MATAILKSHPCSGRTHYTCSSTLNQPATCTSVLLPGSEGWGGGGGHRAGVTNTSPQTIHLNYTVLVWSYATCVLKGAVLGGGGRGGGGKRNTFHY